MTDDKLVGLLEYLVVRERFISTYLGGLLNSKSKVPDAWNNSDEVELLMLKGRKKELESILSIIRANRVLLNTGVIQKKIDALHEYRKSVVVKNRNSNPPILKNGFNYNQRNSIRLSTRKHFVKKGICENCGAEGTTTWHHKKYVPVSKGLKRSDLKELCIPCHRREDKDG